MNKLEAIIGKHPHYYNNEDDTTLYGIIKAFADELEIILNQIDRADDMVGVDTTRGEDLEYRWGSMLNLPRIDKESDFNYRIRLKNSVNILRGGTARSIQFAIAVALGISHDAELMQQRVQVYDAWEYYKSELDDAAMVAGHIVCCVDMIQQSYSTEIKEIVLNSINKSKAAGIAIHFLISNYSLLYYYQLDDLTYEQLNTLTYGDIDWE